MSTTPASDLLRADHRLMETELDGMLHVSKHPELNFVSEMRRALTGIECLSQLHFAKEEDIFYRHLRPHFPSLLAELDEQHERARQIESHLEELIAAAADPPNKRQVEELVSFSTELCDVIQHHIVTEEDELLRLADARLSHQEQESLALKMRKVEPLFCLSDAGWK